MIPASRPSSLNSSLFLRIEAAIILVELAAVSVPAHAYSFAGGTGEPNDPYQIATAGQLIALTKEPSLQSKHFILTANIDLSGTVFLGQAIASFSGTLDGNGMTIRNLVIRPKDWLDDMGLFGILAGTVKNLTIEDVNIVSRSDAGVVANTNYGSIVNCHTTGTVRCESMAGGLTAFNSGRVIDCRSSVWVGSDDLDSLASFVGGLVGGNTGTVIGCRGEGAVQGRSSIGGVVGRNDHGVVVNCSTTADVFGIGFSTGGLVGYNEGLVMSCSSAATVDGQTTGGFVGENSGAVINCYSAGEVKGYSPAAGFAESNSGSLTNCYAAGRVRVRDSWGTFNGFVAKNSGKVINCFWDTESSGRSNDPAATGLGTAQMMQAATYLAAGWDFMGEAANGPAEIWQMPPSGGYPILSAFAGYVPPAIPGQGTHREPYLVSTVADLGYVYHNPQACYKLTAPIDLSSVRWSGAVIPFFSGSFDGNDLIIRGLTIHGGSYLGLFGWLDSGARLCSLGVEDVNMAGWNSIGALVGYSHGTVMNCYSTGSVRGNDALGGLVGGMHAGRMFNSCSTAAVTGRYYVGGLIGGVGIGHLTNCYAAGVVAGQPGPSDPRRNINEVTVGGLVGSSTDGKARGCFWDRDASGLTVSALGEGLTNEQMKDMSTYLAAGWDLTGETGNGLSETWQMPTSGGYSVLSVLHGYRPPVLPGRGTAADPFRVSTAAELGAICYAPEASYKLVTDPDLSQTRWSLPPIPFFSGTFDGQDITINGLRIAGQEDLGLFGTVDSGAEVRNLGVIDVNVAGAASAVGALAGYNYGSINRCYSTGTVYGAGSFIGGLVGVNYGRVTNSSSGAAVSGGYDVGGLVGYNEGDLTLCYSRGTIRGDEQLGGLAGENYLGRVTQCAGMAEIGGRRYLGGLIGYSRFGLVSASYATGSITCDEAFAGGLMAIDERGTVTNCYSQASVSGGYYIAGLIPEGNGTIDKCYSCGKLSGDFPLGGLTASWSLEVTNCFWDRQATGATWSPGATGLSTAAMRDFFTFVAAGWDFVGEQKNGTEDIWIGLIDDYPQLAWQHGN